MKIRIIQTGLREFRDVYEFDLSDEQYAELKQNLQDQDKTISDIDEQDVYDLGFELDTPVETETGDIIEDVVEVELVRTKQKVLEAAE
jgi:hypothetical protein